MIFAIIGLVVGVIMGITGAGGAIISIPLFQLFLNLPIKQATILSLISVFLGTMVNLVGQTSEVKWKIAAGLSIFGVVANILTLPLKEIIPESIIIIILLLIGFYSLWNVWSTKVMAHSREIKRSFPIIAIIGLMLGVVTTLTGLGGGVLLIPILLKVFGMTYEKALPTSLSSIMLISLSAIVLQRSDTLKLINLSEILYIGLGVFLGFGVLKFLFKSFEKSTLLLVRKAVFSFAVLTSMIIVIIKSF